MGRGEGEKEGGGRYCTSVIVFVDVTFIGSVDRYSFVNDTHQKYEKNTINKTKLSSQ